MPSPWTLDYDDAEVEAILDRLTVPIRGGGRLRAREALEHGEAKAVMAAFSNHGGVGVIRALGFIGGAHYCPVCMNEFHADLGQHEPGCDRLAELRREADEL